MARRYLFNKSMNTYFELQGLSKAEKVIPYHPEAGHHYHQYNDQQIAHARADALDARDHFAKQAHQAETAGQHTRFREAEEKYATQLDSLRAIRQWREKQSKGQGISGMPSWYHEEYDHGSKKSFGKGILNDMGNDYPLGDADSKPRKGPSAIERRRGKGPMMTLTRQGDVVTRTPAKTTPRGQVLPPGRTLSDYHPALNPGSAGFDGQRYPKATHNPDGTRKSFRKAEFATAAGNKFKIPLPGDARNIQEERPENRSGPVRPPVSKKLVLKTNRPFGVSTGPGPNAVTEDNYRKNRSKNR